MLEGIKILIERMDSNPEEFFGELSYRWSAVMQDIAKHGPEFLSEEDLLMLNNKVKEIRRKELTAKIMEELTTAERLREAQEKASYQKELSKTAILGNRAGKSLVGAAYWQGNTYADSTLKMTVRDESMLEDMLTRTAIDRHKRDEFIEAAKFDREMNEKLLKSLTDKSQTYKKRKNQKWP